MIEVRLLGEFALWRDGRPLPLPASRKTRALFVYLLLEARPRRREQLCDYFFDVPDDPRAGLRWSLSKIRAMLGEDAGLLVADRERVALDTTGFIRDIDRLDADRVLEAPLPGLDLPGPTDYALWLGAERAAIDRARIAWLNAHVDDPALPAATRARLAAALAMLGGPPAAPPPRPIVTQDIRYCTASDGVRLAYAVTGTGPVLVKAANWLNHLELDWGSPLWGGMVEGLSRHFRFVRHDARCNGLSDWDAGEIAFEALVGDLETVVDALGLDRFPLFGLSQGAAVAIEYAARHPARVSHLILLGGYATGWRHRVDAADAAEREAVITLVRHGWGKESPLHRHMLAHSFTPSATPAELDWFNDFQRATVSPDNAARFLDLFGSVDVRHRLAAITVPTLILHARNDRRIELAQAIELAASIRHASLVTLDSDNHILRAAEPATEVVIERIRAFLAAT